VGELIERAAKGDAAALKELEAPVKPDTPESLREKIWTIVITHLANADGHLGGKAGGPPRPKGTAHEYGAALLEWVLPVRPKYNRDSKEGLAIAIVELCAGTLRALDSAHPDFMAGFEIGYNLSKANHLLVREFGDGPALAREHDAQAHRAEGGRTRAEQNNQRDKGAPSHMN
jgi:hypothetical protein